MKNTEKYKATIMLNKNEWELFKKITKMNESDASKEIRKFIKNYIAGNSDKVAELLKLKGEEK
jgi:hypothetical protein